MRYVTFHAKMYTKGFVLNGQSHWLAIDNLLKAFTKVLEVLEEQLCFSSLPVGGRRLLEIFVPSSWKYWKKPYTVSVHFRVKGHICVTS